MSSWLIPLINDSNWQDMYCLYFSLYGIMIYKFLGEQMTATEAAKVDDYRLQDYELVLIISPEVGDEALDATLDNISKFVTGSGGAISNVERWGKRRLAYPLRQFLEGNYVLTQFKLKPAMSKQLEANLHISEEVLRHLLVKSGS